VLPTDRLNDRGRPLGELRQALYRIPNVRNAFNVLGVWVQTAGLLVLACWVSNPLLWVLSFFLMGRGMVMFAILAHEAAHRLLFSNRKVNDFVGRWLVGAPGFVPLDAYRRGHMAHHKEEFGANEPDLALYAGYPIERASWHRKLMRDATGQSGYKNLVPLIRAVGSPTARPHALRIWSVQAALWVAGGVGLGRWWLWPVMWFGPWMTVWRVLNRLRSVAEHGGMRQSLDRRVTTHHITQSWLARFWMVPYNTGWHLAHHVDIGVPFQNLPRLQGELERSGWVVSDLAWPSYWAFWRHASSGVRPDA
jgi:fatty acid desaturase